MSKCHTKNRLSLFWRSYPLSVFVYIFLMFLEDTNLLLCSCKYTVHTVSCQKPGIRRKGKRKSFCLPSLCDDHSFFGNIVLSWPLTLWHEPKLLFSCVGEILRTFTWKTSTLSCLFFTQSPFLSVSLTYSSVVSLCLFLSQFMLNSLVGTQVKTQNKQNSGRRWWILCWMFGPLFVPHGLSSQEKSSLCALPQSLPPFTFLLPPLGWIYFFLIPTVITFPYLFVLHSPGWEQTGLYSNTDMFIRCYYVHRLMFNCCKKYKDLP